MSKSKETGFSHSDSYHEYFEGYSERKISAPGPMGHKIERIYIQEYYEPVLSPAGRLGVRLLYLFLYVLAVICLFSPMFVESVLSYVTYIALFQFLCIITVVLLAVPLIICLCSGRKLTVGEYKTSSVTLKRFSLAAATIDGLTTAACLFYLLTHLRTVTAYDVLQCVIMLIGATAIALINRIESKIPYHTIENPNKSFEEGNEIW